MSSKTESTPGFTVRENERESAFAHERREVEPEMLWHPIIRPNERGWRGKEGESARKDLLYMYLCTLHVPTWKNGGCLARRGGIKRSSGCIGFRGGRNFGPEVGFDHVKVLDRGPETK
jgi:hypothetical protein